MPTSALRAVAAAFFLAVPFVQTARAEEAKSGPEQAMTQFLLAFAAGDYDACRALRAAPPRADVITPTAARYRRS